MTCSLRFSWSSTYSHPQNQRVPPVNSHPSGWVALSSSWHMLMARESNFNAFLMLLMSWSRSITSMVLESSSSSVLVCAQSTRLSTCWEENIGCTLHSFVLSEYLSQQHVRASGLAPNLPSLKWILRLNCKRNLDHCT